MPWQLVQQRPEPVFMAACGIVSHKLKSAPVGMLEEDTARRTTMRSPPPGIVIFHPFSVLPLYDFFVNEAAMLQPE